MASSREFFNTPTAADLAWRFGSTFIVAGFPYEEFKGLRGAAFWKKAAEFRAKATPFQNEYIDGKIKFIESHSWTGVAVGECEEHFRRAKELLEE